MPGRNGMGPQGRGLMMGRRMGCCWRTQRNIGQFSSNIDQFSGKNIAYKVDQERESLKMQEQEAEIKLAQIKNRLEEIETLSKNSLSKNNS